MIAKPDCMICILKQFLQINRMCGLSEEAVYSELFRMMNEIPKLARNMTPPEITAHLSDMVEKSTGISDPYKEIKIASNKAALSLYPELKARVENAENPFAEALCLAIAGNLIDYGAKANLDLHDTLNEILSQPLFQHIETGEDFDEELFQLGTFYKELSAAENIMYLGDNAGEIVFDRIFIETLIKKFPDKKITFVVRGGPALNDALLEDADDVGISSIVKVISSGSATAGTVLSNCTNDFLEKLHAADLVISKGQGNYETLVGEKLPPTWFLFRIKCSLVAAHAGGPEGALVLKKNTNK